MKGGLFLLALLAAWPLGAQAGTYVLGDEEHPWEGGGAGLAPESVADPTPPGKVDTTNAPGAAIEFARRPGWISPRFFADTTNIAGLVLEQGGAISAPNLLSANSQVLRRQLEGTVNGDHRIAFERKRSIFDPQAPIYGIWIALDFGRPLGLQRVRFYPRNTVFPAPDYPSQNDYLRSFELFLNEQQTNTLAGAPDVLVARQQDNRSPVVEVSFSPRYARLVKLRSLTEVPFEIDEIEVYGAGYLREAVYLSDLIDLGGPASIGPVRWEEETAGEPSFSSLIAETRTGLDQTPLLYRRYLREEGAVIGDEEISAAQYANLDPRDLLPIAEDTLNWSGWSRLESGSPLRTPLPRRYLQFRFQFAGGLFATRQVRRLEFDYLVPPLADTVRAEVFPRQVDLEKPTAFHYAVRFMSRGQARGFDLLEVDTPAPAERLRDLTIDGVPARFQVEEVRREGFRLRLPLIDRDGAVLTFTFDLPIYRFGTTFSGRVYHSGFPEVSQPLEPGQVLDFGPGDESGRSGLSVAIPTLQLGRLLGQVAVSGRLFTPNRDGIGDSFALSFNLLQVLHPVPVTLAIYDLAGRRCAKVSGDFAVGPAYLAWDGRLETGALTPPGHYLWVLEARADYLEERRSGVLGVVY
jgi:hypothetical protein